MNFDQSQSGHDNRISKLKITVTIYCNILQYQAKYCNEYGFAISHAKYLYEYELFTEGA